MQTPTIHTPEASAEALALMTAALDANNGYTFAAHVSTEAREILAAAGYIVTPGRDAFMRPCLMVYSPRGHAGAMEERARLEREARKPSLLDLPDIEGGILDRCAHLID